MVLKHAKKHDIDKICIHHITMLSSSIDYHTWLSVIEIYVFAIFLKLIWKWLSFGFALIPSIQELGGGGTVSNGMQYTCLHMN